MIVRELYELVAEAWWARLSDAEREDIVRRAAASGQRPAVRAAREMAEHMKRKKVQNPVIRGEVTT